MRWHVSGNQTLSAERVTQDANADGDDDDEEDDDEPEDFMIMPEGRIKFLHKWLCP